MILADDIMAAPGTEYDKFAMGSFSRMATVLEHTPKFVLDRQTVAVVSNLSNSSPRAIMSARSMAFPPFPVFWIEWRFQDVRDAMDNPPSICEGRYEPERVGILVETVPHDPLAGMMTQCWSWEDGLEMSMLVQLYDMGEGEADLDSVMNWFDLPFRVGQPDSRQKVEADIEANREMLASSVQQHLRRDPGQFTDLIDELMRFDFACNPRMVDMLRAMIRRGHPPDLCALCRDWEREAISVVSAMIMLNSRDIVEREPVSQDRINRKRARTGKPRLCDHTVLRPHRSIGLPKGGVRGASAAHLVRAHLKVRKTGVFPWRAHVRGDGEVRAGKQYEVRR